MGRGNHCASFSQVPTKYKYIRVYRKRFPWKRSPDIYLPLGSVWQGGFLEHLYLLFNPGNKILPEYSLIHMLDRGERFTGTNVKPWRSLVKKKA